MPPLAPPDCQAGIAVEPIESFVIDRDTFQSNQDVQAPIAEPAPLSGEFDQSGLQLLILGLRL